MGLDTCVTFSLGALPFITPFPRPWQPLIFLPSPYFHLLQWLESDSVLPSQVGFSSLAIRSELSSVSPHALTAYFLVLNNIPWPG